MFVVIEEDYYGRDSGYVVTNTYGPYPEGEARRLAEKLNANPPYAHEFSVHELSLTIPE